MGYKIGDIGLVSKRPKVAIPDINTQRSIKASMGLNPHESFWKCRHRSKTKVRAFEESGDTSHSGKNHSCPECRCDKIAGSHTEHYGVGFCFTHENVTGSTRSNNEAIAQHQTEAVRQGYPEKTYKYNSTSKFLDKVREVAEASGGATDLREEMILVRDKIQELVSFFENKKTRGSLTEGHDKEGNARQMTDATYYKLLTQMTGTVAKLTSTNLAVTEQDYVHIDQVNIWFAQVIRIIQKTLEAEHPDGFKDIVDKIKLVPQMKKGRIK